ncbi:hypothetical protein ACM92B_003736 [Cronobacter dublinensis]|uniref:hypothetical protein n=1 Tax=Cronobacter dublinensis TaxID=413497 RepID=UPI000CFAC51E|nr:hypothetical protein [Cronobacter dublinensis]ELY4003383.1 hypothetical protein [Cronobacter dublinensis]
MGDSLGYMEYDLSGLNKIESLEKAAAQDIFINIYEGRKKYELDETVDYKDLERVLVDELYVVMNNEPRRKGKKIFFTGNAARAYKKDILEFIKQPVEKHDLIIPLLILPTNDIKEPQYFISTQEDPVFEIMKLKIG